MDPWMMGRIRLADRRGLLAGRNISRVQEGALEILAINEAFGKAMADLSRSANREVPTEIIMEEVTEANVDDDGEDLVWKMPEMDRRDVLDVLAVLGQGGEMSAADLE